MFLRGYFSVLHLRQGLGVTRAKANRRVWFDFYNFGLGCGRTVVRAAVIQVLTRASQQFAAFAFGSALQTRLL